MKRNLKIMVATFIIGLLLMAEGAGIAIGIMSRGVSFELPTGITIQKEGHEIELIDNSTEMSRGSIKKAAY